jgi:uncharacterized membrane protein
MNRDRISRVILRIFALTAIFVGILSLFGVRPMYSRTIEVVLGSALLLAGLALLTITKRSKSASPAVGPV